MKKTKRNFRHIILFISALSVFHFPTASQSKYKFSVSANFPALLERLPYQANKPIAREIRYIYGNMLQLGMHKPRPNIIVSNEKKGYKRHTTDNTDWPSIIEQNKLVMKAMGQSQTEFLNKNSDWMTPQAMTSYMGFQRSMQSSIATLNLTMSAMSGLEAIGRGISQQEAESLVKWTEKTTHCSSEEAPEGSVLHLEVIWVVQGKSFKTYSSNDIIVVATLETGDGRMITSVQSMQKWVDNKKKTVSPPDALPMYESIPADKRPLLSPLLEKHGILPLDAVLVNAAVEDLCLRMQALQEIGQLRGQRK